MKTHLLLSFMLGIKLLCVAQSGNNWVTKPSLPGSPRVGAASFSIGNKGYVCGGAVSPSPSSYLNDFWEWDAMAGIWIRKADLPFKVVGATGFSIGNKGYVVGGQLVDGSMSASLWEWDPQANTWTAKAEFSGPARAWAAGFSIGLKGYVCAGYDTSGKVTGDLWEWDQVSDQWTRKTDIPGPARQSAVAFTINGKGYVGLGSDLYDDGLADLWEWDPAGDSWFQKTGLTGEERSGASAFVLNSKAYICSGFNNGFVLNDMWEFDAQGNSWTSKGSLNSGAAFAVAFSAAGKGYMSCGLAANYVSTSRLFEYQGATVSAHSVPLSASGCQVYGNGFGAAAIKLPEGTEKVSLHIIDIFGKEIKRTSILHPGEPNVIDCSELKSGAFIYQVKNKEQLICSGYLITVR